MPTITISIDAGAKSRSVSKTITAAHTTRFLDAMRRLYGQVDDGEGGQRDMTDAETFDAWANGIFAGTRANVKRAEAETAKAAADDGVTEIGLT